MKMAVIGDEVFVRMFELVGAIGYIAEDDEAALSQLEKIIENKEYGIIILPERYVDLTKTYRERMLREDKYYPLFVFLPDHTGVKEKRIEELKKLISMAVGIELKL